MDIEHHQMTDRVDRMIKSLKINKYPLCVQQFRLAVEALDESAGEDMITRRSKVQERILDKINIFMDDDELILGEGADKPFGLEMTYEYGVWTKDEVDSLKSEIYTISPEDEKELYELNERFAGNSMNQNLIGAMSKSLGQNDRLWPFMKSGVILPPWKSRTGGSGGGYAMSGMGLGPGFYLIAVDYDRILKEGAKGVIAEAKQCLEDLRYTEVDSIKKQMYWEGIVRVFEAWCRWAGRYADLAESKAAECTDPQRKAELLEMARICRKVPYNPPETFREAIQAYWMTFLMACPSPTTSLGRMDQLLYPFYKHDIEAGLITDEEVLELLEVFRVKVMKINRVSGKANRTKNSGMAKWYNATIGGVIPETGEDATNELTYLILDAAEETALPHHTVTLRVHEKTPPELLRRALKVVRSGIGMPAFVGDKSYEKFFVDNGMSVEDARDYCMTGCVDGNIPAKTRTLQVTFFITTQCLDIFMHNGFCRYTNEMVGKQLGDVTKMETFDEFKEKFYQQMDFLISEAAERQNVELIAENELFQNSFISALTEDGVKCGHDSTDRQLFFENGCVLGCVGGVNTGDSLEAIKKLVYDEKKYTMQQLLDALDADWEGYEEMHQDFLNAPKYGNNISEPDTLTAEVYQRFADFCYSNKEAYGGTIIPNAISISAHQPGGAVTGATPDGRKGGQVLADASLSPERGFDKEGPLAVMESALKINADPYQGMLHNMKFTPSALKTDEDLDKLGSAIKTYLSAGAKHIQFNVVNRDELVDAKENPQDHDNLVVRVAGYSAYFVRLTPQIQDEVIDRTAFDEVQ